MAKELTDAELAALVKKQVKDNADKDWDKASKSERNSSDEFSGYWANGDKKK